MDRWGKIDFCGDISVSQGNLPIFQDNIRQNICLVLDKFSSYSEYFNDIFLHGAYTTVGPFLPSYNRVKIALILFTSPLSVK